MNLFHYTNKAGWNGIRSQPVWVFKASQPNTDRRPEGAYFTVIEPSEENLPTLFQRVRIPKIKQEFVFWFTGDDNLIQLGNGRGRDQYIYYSSTDYNVLKERQIYGAKTSKLLGEFE